MVIPTNNSADARPRYDGPFTIHAPHRVRAVAIRAGVTSLVEADATFLFAAGLSGAPNDPPAPAAPTAPAVTPPPPPAERQRERPVRPHAARRDPYSNV